MALWLIRAGRHGEFEKRFLDEDRVYLTWGGLSHDLVTIEGKTQLRTLLESIYHDAPVGRISNNLAQIWAFSHRMISGDWVVLPSKQKPAIHVAELKGKYVFDSDGTDPFFHYREVEWLVKDVPRTNFDQDLLYSFGAFLTICQVRRNDAEKRVRQMAENEWKSVVTSAVTKEDENGDGSDDAVGFDDLAQAARDQLANGSWLVFKGTAWPDWSTRFYVLLDMRRT